MYPAPTSAEIDWPLLILLARTDAAMTWPDLPRPDDFDLSLPNGLDLHARSGRDWVTQVSGLV